MEVKEECLKDGSVRVLSNRREVYDRWMENFDGILNLIEIGLAEITPRP